MGFENYTGGEGRTGAVSRRITLQPPRDWFQQAEKCFETESGWIVKGDPTLRFEVPFH